MGFLGNLFGGGRRDRSASVAKQRLMMVLVDDRYKLTPDMLEQMKIEMAEVLSRYLPHVDSDQIEVTLLRGEANDHLKAEIPLKRGRDE
ncbi:cell division topological specificity factor MinE [Candidatus Chloroploca sp. M-50]|uniref:Cell division topological specificity factor n=2 Tax=Candidatus Chloroploca TaxID=1579476 RepID=A0A2H3KHI0_9CHLR|nr:MULTISPECIES: cell division topological specificity factor MinE [Candidatus Chloroploca]MBP1465411.1 cell division topological specificity factor MinE [Candidatus Chloroploca mongolica]PDV97213.1 cell division topological specificity factor MinE [Candidatus Chloroploca asiatica]